jgi:putative Ca2+/H+ antiporter (TMEM165/GDT1 family)
LHAFLISAGLVALAEIGDRTQILSILLAARYRRPIPIIAGILAATIANHLVAVALGAWLGDALKGPWMRWVLGISFFAFAAWTLVPDKLSEDESPKERGHGSVFLTTLVSFFFAEIGDKTQIVAAALGARFQAILWVTAGTTLGMMLANVPAVYLGEMAATRLPVRPLRFVAAAAMAAQGAWTLFAPS